MRITLNIEAVHNTHTIPLPPPLQHACDEKHRFETLQQSTVIHEQPLVCPTLVQVPASACATAHVVLTNLTIQPI